MKKNSKLRDYRFCENSLREILPCLLQSAGAMAILAYFFYRSLWALPALVPVGIFYYRSLRERRRCRQVLALTLQFKETILSVSTSLLAGYAVENAFLESRQDIEMLYGKESFMYKELETIRRGIVMNVTLEDLLSDLGCRSGSEDLAEFAAVFAIAKRSGGNLSDIIRNTAELTMRRIESMQEIQTLLSGRKLEQSIMRCIPFVLILYISAGNPGYFDGLYHNFQGVLVMSGCLCLYLISWVMGDKIIDGIQV